MLRISGFFAFLGPFFKALASRSASIRIAEDQRGDRALRGDTHIQRGRPSPAHRHFGSATPRTGETDATTPAGRPEDHPTQDPTARRLTTGGPERRTSASHERRSPDVSGTAAQRAERVEAIPIPEIDARKLLT